jgi:hypothetical protein
MTVVDYADYQTPQAHATAIASTGVPLLAGDIILGTPLVGQALAAGASITAFSGAVTGIAYIAFVDALNSNGATSANPFLKVSMIWKDAVGGNTLPPQHWFPLQTNVSPASSNGLVCGRGPTDGAVLTVLIKNMDLVNAVTVDFELIQSARPITRHDWRNVSNNVSGNYTFGGLTVPTPVSDASSLLLGCSPGIPINGGAVASRINGLYAGQAQLEVSATAIATVTGFVYDPEFGTPLQQVFPPTPTPVNANIALPRLPLIVQIANGGGAAITATYSLVAQEFAS